MPESLYLGGKRRFEAISNTPRGPKQSICTASCNYATNRISRQKRIIHIFPKEQSKERLIGVLLMEQHERWISGKAHFAEDASGEKKTKKKEAAQEDLKQFMAVAKGDMPRGGFTPTIWN